MRYLYVLVGLAALLSAAYAAEGSFKVGTDVMTYVDASNADTSFSDNDTLWVSSVDGKPVKEAYLSFINNFITAQATKPDRIQSATLKIYAKTVEKPGMIKAYFVEGPTLAPVTWDTKPEYERNVSASLDVQKSGEYSLDVTPIVKRAIEACPGECGYSVVLIADDNASIELSKKAPEKPSLEYTTA